MHFLGRKCDRTGAREERDPWINSKNIRSNPQEK